ncbi:hypothetical protein HETIRDRAFT_119010 [Heterobasidion irregulare TC 32-1]|uniref:Uncharacterized protein n=1 Tax=Heterobasidion irregulare (strain TC 32-1) TaxID=747525 RepID=W4JUX7_HETIT|nr:uncharacterized protein HETIRDRAFT_119010 [Heterobasidion irregulare TC 32-1]ETW76885.1 hypothetical protein HETIRDRAFT_119010 [Heterobasidion irregulare TC 32-1]
MPAPIIQHLTDNHRVICLTIEDWRNIYGMSPIKPDSVRALDKVPPTLQPLADGPHRWLFERKLQVGYDGRAGLSIDSVVDVIQSHDIHEMQPLEIPVDWKASIHESSQIRDFKSYSRDRTASQMRTSLCQFVDNVHNAWSSIPVLLYRPRSHFATIPYPKPNVTLHELRDPRMTLYSVEWTIFKILCKGNSRVTGYSVLDPPLFYDTLLPAICHQIRGCNVLRSIPITFPTYSADHGSSTCLDFVCQPSTNNLPNGLPGEYIPALFAAHHVDILHAFELSEISYVRPGPSELMPDRNPGLVKLVKVFQPSLQLLVMYLTKKYRIDNYRWHPEWNRYPPMLSISELEDENLRITNPRPPNIPDQDNKPSADFATREKLYENPEKYGYTRKERLDKAVDEYWENINVHSGAIEWQRTHGVLWRVSRAPTSEGNKSVITASVQYDLSRLINMTDADLDVMEIQNVTRAVLKAHIAMLETKLGRNLIRIDTIDETHNPVTEEDAMGLDVITLELWDNAMPKEDAKEPQLYIEFNMLYTLLWPGGFRSASELAVERVIGVIIAPYLELKDCETLSGQSVRLSLILGCFGYFTSADICTKMLFKPPVGADGKALQEYDDLSVLQPVILGAEAKRTLGNHATEEEKLNSTQPNVKANSKRKIKNTPMHRASAQLAFLFQPTLKIFIGHLCELAESGSEDYLREKIEGWDSLPLEARLREKVGWAEWTKVTIPEWMFCYGIGYDFAGFTVYSFHPALFVENGKPHWEFHCCEMVTGFEEVFLHFDAKRRVHAVKTLLAMRRHSHFLAQTLRGPNQLLFPEEFIKVAKEMSMEDEAKKWTQAETRKQNREKKSQSEGKSPSTKAASSKAEEVILNEEGKGGSSRSKGKQTSGSRSSRENAKLGTIQEDEEEAKKDVNRKAPKRDGGGGICGGPYGPRSGKEQGIYLEGQKGQKAGRTRRLHLHEQGQRAGGV